MRTIRDEKPKRASLRTGSPRGRKKKGGPQARQDVLEPIYSERKRKRFSVIDLESKDGDTQKPGFTRPFLVGLLDVETEKYYEFRDEPHLRERPWETRHIQPGGCIDKLLSKILTREFSGSVFYAHNGGGFDWLFILTWLRDHSEEYGFEVVPIQSTIQVIRVWKKEDPEEEEPEEEPQRRRGRRKTRNNVDQDVNDEELSEEDASDGRRRKTRAQEWEFLDSFRLVPMSLDKACQAFLTKEERARSGKIQVDLGMHENDPRWSEYLRKDCSSLAAVMMRLESMIEKLGGELGITTPSTAMKLFRRTFMGRDGVPERIRRYQHWPGCRDSTNGRCVGCAHQWTRRGYYGGRTEIHEFYGEDLRYVDINSSYVFAMKADMPIGERLIDVGKLDWSRHTSRGGAFSGFAECTVYVPPDCKIPPLPHRDKRTGKLIFPTGRFTGVWSVEELALLGDPLVGGRVEHVTMTVWFRLMPMFGSMVTELWKLRDPRREGYDEGLSQFAKLLGNSTYGKFAMKQIRHTIAFAIENPPAGTCFLCGDLAENPEPVAESDDMFPRRRGTDGRSEVLCGGCEGSKPTSDDLDGDVWYQRQRVDASYIIPHVASHITAMARVRLWKTMKTAIVLGGRIFYTDTDSVITNAQLPTDEELPALALQHPGVELIPISPRLGDLKDEYPGESLRFTAIQPKVYMIEPMRLNADVARRQAILKDATELGGDELDASVLDGTVVKNLDEIGESQDTGRKNYTLDHQAKVTMKGFPREQRTKDNLALLSAGGVLRWRRLEKVRALAGEDFSRPPRVIDVCKSFRSEYDKRVRVENGTRAIVLEEEDELVEVPEEVTGGRRRW